MQMFSPGADWMHGSVEDTHCFVKQPLNDGLLQRLMAFPSLADPTRLGRFLAQENGFFSIVLIRGQSVILATDRVRTLPLFYAYSSEGWRVSDKPDGLQGGRGALDHDKVEELRRTGFVVGGSTAYKGICQVESAQIVTLSNKDGSAVSAERYSDISYNDHDLDDDQLEQEFESAVAQTIDTLIGLAGGRQIIVPLSGGTDSRLIAMELAKRNYPNLVAFSYGREARESCSVARALGIPWICCRNSADEMAGLWRSQIRTDYTDFASRGASLPHYQDFFAVQALAGQGRFDSDAIFVPGHTADVQAGNHLPGFVFSETRVPVSMITHEIAKKHFALWKGGEFDDSRLAALQVGKKEVSALEAAQILDSFNIQERQAKYIVNAVRVYEFFGFQWWLPFWDRRFVAFFAALPMRCRSKRWWYKEQVHKRYARMTGTRFSRDAGGLANLAKSARPRLGRYLRQSPVGYYRTRSEWMSHPMNPYALFDDKFVDGCMRTGASLLGVFSEEFARGLRNGEARYAERTGAPCSLEAPLRATSGISRARLAQAESRISPLPIVERSPANLRTTLGSGRGAPEPSTPAK